MTGALFIHGARFGPAVCYFYRFIVLSWMGSMEVVFFKRIENLFHLIQSYSLINTKITTGCIVANSFCLMCIYLIPLK